MYKDSGFLQIIAHCLVDPVAGMAAFQRFQPPVAFHAVAGIMLLLALL